MGGIEFLKGHGTQNDFVVLPDPEGKLELTEERVRALCDRRRGIGADGVLRVTRAGAMPTEAPDVESIVDRNMWFMDYRNADGSIAEMCGNGVRVYARYLREAGLVEGSEFVLGTRAGARGVVFNPDDTVTVDMGSPHRNGHAAVRVGETEYDAMSVNVGNQHAVSIVEQPVAGIDLSAEPAYEPEDFPDGANFEFVNVVSEDVLRMRVYERGVGETRSCGTGTVAAAKVYIARKENSNGVGTADVLVPGGRVSVRIMIGASTLTGPAELVARGELDESWWRSAAEPV
ncbi:diaminopimelate epimerase [Tamaricihabitans halophyticus]|uniref:Diaminopimelate epimerase n=1 Tax=Tamaricihabitans halophyticus TaxID=1262583 RepID=A0A4R2QZQ1_9PSEU|nr:diaminopimelate epimerase [Tamaricihabitans halophyticus]TCP55177.1 diaminopimelate epimerase [Tamaricihabitans halophyticus]